MLVLQVKKKWLILWLKYFSVGFHYPPHQNNDMETCTFYLGFTRFSNVINISALDYYCKAGESCGSLLFQFLEMLICLSALVVYILLKSKWESVILLKHLIMYSLCFPFYLINWFLCFLLKFCKWYTKLQNPKWDC